MPTVVHPRLPHDRHTVPADQLDRWLAVGWLRVDQPPVSTPPAEDAPNPDPAPHNRRHSSRTTRKD